MLTRIYGTAFLSKEALAEHLERLELARARDHRRLGRQLGLFHFSELSPGTAFWTPHGTTLWNTLRDLSGEMARARGYSEVKTPQLFDPQLWRISGHWDNYREHMFLTSDADHPMGLKPMNCPGHCLLYAMDHRSYRELPVRFYEPGLLHRNEPSGTLHGLLRVRQFAQDDSHIYCAEEQIQAEVVGCLEFGFEIYRLFDFEVSLELSTRPQKRIGDDALWDRAEGALTAALEGLGLDYHINEGDGAFYGPKIDLNMTDSLGRAWQLGTVQLDYSLPERFELAYTGADNAEHRPVMIHRALFGSVERFFGVLIEHYAGAFPLWLAPVQVGLVPISERHHVYAKKVEAELKAAGLRVEVDDRNEKMNGKIRDFANQKTPYILVFGDKEEAANSVSVRTRGKGDQGSIPLANFIAKAKELVASQSTEL
jgi:threonyl-tRNA synthetase